MKVITAKRFLNWTNKHYRSDWKLCKSIKLGDTGNYVYIFKSKDGLYGYMFECVDSRRSRVLGLSHTYSLSTIIAYLHGYSMRVGKYFYLTTEAGTRKMFYAKDNLIKEVRDWKH